MIIDLNQCFPESPQDGSRGPLPKQAVFIESALDLKGPKYIRYVGGIGSGKTMIGCITVLSWAVLYPGDYLVGRQFFPELRDTTYQTFLDICPKELILEERVADKVILIRSRGGVARILFRALEEPDKMRSLNLNGFYVDEANQCSEAAFILLQGRLRGKHLRKGIITQNSGGHDWSWRWFVKQDMFKTDDTKRMFLNIVAPTTENVHLPDGYVQTMLDTWSKERVEREIFANEDSFEGQVYNEFAHNIHVVKPFEIPENWTRITAADHGYRNPAAWVFGAVDYDGNIYIYREYYEREKEIPVICKTVGQWILKDKVRSGVIDPATKANRGTGTSEYYEYTQHLPESFTLGLANNNVQAGIDKVKQYLKVDHKTGKPRMFIFENCAHLLDEISTYRWDSLRHSQEGHRNEKEKPKKVNDHACDALRYLIMTRPDAPIELEDWESKVKYNSLEHSLQKEMHEIRSPKARDPFQDN